MTHNRRFFRVLNFFPAIPLLVVASSGTSLADTVYLKNGAWIDGIVRTRSTEVIQVDIGSIGKLEIPFEEVYRIEKNSRTGSMESLSVAGRVLEVEVDPTKKDEEGDDDDDNGDDDDHANDGRPLGDSLLGEEEEIDPKLKARIEKLVSDLERKKSRYRVRAERHLKAVGPPAAPFLVPLAKSRSDLVRISVFRLFHSFGEDGVIEECIEALVDSNEYVRDYAHRVLKRVTGEKFGYKPLASPRRRESAQKKWKKWWAEEKELLAELEATAGE